MVEPKERIECYREYLGFEEGIRFMLKALSFSFWEGRTWNNFGKVLFPLLCLYFSVCGFAAYFIPNASLMQQIMSLMIIISMIQIFTKTTSILYCQKDLNDIFYWLRDIHCVSQFESVNRSAQILLKDSVYTAKKLSK